MWAPRLIGVVVAQTGAGHIRWEATIGRPACLSTLPQENSNLLNGGQRTTRNKDNSEKTFAPLFSLLVNFTTAEIQQR